MARAESAPEEIPLWPGATPGDLGIDPQDEKNRRSDGWHWLTRPDNDTPGAEYSRVFTSQIPGLGAVRIRTNVSKPTLTLYRPDPAKNTGVAMLICPGGGYHNLLWELEGEQVAEWAASVGITGIILKYRVPRRADDPEFGKRLMPPARGPLLDAQRAVSLVRSRAAEWGVHPRRIGIVGFSAGGHLALRTATCFERRRYERQDAHDEADCRPDFAVSCYSGYLKANEKDEVTADFESIPAGSPPIMLVHTADDSVSDPLHSLFMALALQRAGVPTELHMFVSGQHDFAVRQEEHLLPSSWTALFLNWLRDRGVLPV
ncbi:MAG: alpha/beta hydrolase [Planctomycetota bacterium]|nr:alpha/beta hydrolase [Planctomycetota bacterium]